MSQIGIELLDQTLPQDAEGERFVLGAALSKGHEAFAVISELLGAPDFSIEPHRRIYSHAQRLFDAGQELNTHSVALSLQQTGHLASVGGLAYLADLLVPLTGTVLRSYCERLRDLAIRRRGIMAAQSLIADLYQGEMTTDALISAERITSLLGQESNRQIKVRTAKQVITCGEGGINAFLSPHKHPGIRIPFETIHKTLSGWRRGKYILLAARPAVGKSAFVHSCMIAAANSGKRTLLVTLEMIAEDVLHREIAGRAQVSAYRFREGGLNKEQFEAVMKQATMLSDLEDRLLFVDQPLSIPALKGLLRSLAAEGKPVDLVIEDYLQLFDTETAGNREQEVAKLSRASKSIAQTFGIPVLAISNLSRKGTKETDEPELHWLRDSGQLEYDADQILFFWPAKELHDIDEERIVNWKVAKQKDGILNHGTITFLTKYCRFAEAQDGPPQEFQSPSFYNQNGDNAYGGYSQ